MLKFFCILTGDDYSSLVIDTPASKKKVSLLATCLLLPIFIWFLNGFLLVSQVLKGSLINAFVAAFLCSGVIFLLERAIIMANGHKNIYRFRLVIGVIVAILGAIVIDEVFFEKDINTQVLQNEQTMREKYINKQTTTSGTNLEKQEALKAEKYSAWQNAVNAANQEADGSGGSGHRGVSAITKQKEYHAQQALDEYQSMLSELNKSKNLNEKDRNDAILEFNKSFDSNSLLIRIKAMFQLVFSDIAIAISYLLFFVLMLFLEILVIFFKKYCPETNYEMKIRLIDEIGKVRLDKMANRDATSFDPRSILNNVKHAKEEVKKPAPTYL